jgi:putative ubiquitin-RnfH superfamily antitoxin RatB of RatAB toxin-antitoxin module
MLMGTLRVEVVYALPRVQEAVVVDLAPGATVADAIEASGLPSRHPSLREEMQAVGINGRIVTLERPIADGDRVEIYRPLLADPMTARRQRANKV